MPMKLGTRPLSNYQAIWNVVRLIPKGRVATYGEVAEQAGLPGQARLVGYALHHLPSHSSLPWHRVISARGEISLPKEGGQYQRQLRLLKQEGIRLHRGKVDLSKYGWLKRSNRMRRSAG